MCVGRGGDVAHVSSATPLANDYAFSSAVIVHVVLIYST